MAAYARSYDQQSLAGEDQAFALRTLALKLAHTAHGFGIFASTLFRRLLKVVAAFHFAEGTFALHLFFQCFQRLIDVIVTHKDLSQGSPQYIVRRSSPRIELNLMKVRSGHVHKWSHFVHLLAPLWQCAYQYRPSCRPKPLSELSISDDIDHTDCRPAQATRPN
jgi:hypothetical protein